MMRRILLFIFILLGCAMGSVLWIAHDPRPLAMIARWSLERAFPDVRVTDFKIGKHVISPQKTVFEDVFCATKISGHILVVQVKRLEVADFSTFFSNKKTLHVHLAGADVDFEPGKAHGITADLTIFFLDKRSILVTGPLTAQALLWDKLKAEKTSCQLKSDAKSVELWDILSEAYGGTITGMARIFLKPISYDADIKISRLQTSKLAEFNEQIGAQMAGRISGIVRVAGDVRRVTLIDADLQMPSGGKVNAALLSALTQYLPQSQERKRLDVLIKNGGKLAVETFSFTMKSNTPDHLSGLIKLASKEANIELNLTHDIQTDGTWDGLAQYWQAIFK